MHFFVSLSRGELSAHHHHVLLLIQPVIPSPKPHAITLKKWVWKWGFDGLHRSWLKDFISHEIVHKHAAEDEQKHGLTKM